VRGSLKLATGCRDPAPLVLTLLKEDVAMRTSIDFSPLYRSTVGFDRLFSLLDGVTHGEAAANWPPYNIEKKSDHAYCISMALAGFGADEIELTQNGNDLIVTGQKKAEAKERQMLHQGIAFRNFKQTFSLADHVKVASADLQNGVLSIELVREVPEQLKPRRIAIGGAPEKLAAQDNDLKQVDQGRMAERKTA
jgi:molecular chaperone IbpA